MKIDVLHPTKITLDAQQIKQIVLFESSKGMLKRVTGDLFKKDNIEFEFVKTIILPERGGKFSTSQELASAITTTEENEKIKILDENKFGNPNSSRAAIIIVLKNLQTNENIGILKYRSSVSTITIWSQTDFGNETGFKRISSDKTKLSTVEAESLKIKPSDLINDDAKRGLQQLQAKISASIAQLISTNELPQICGDHIKLIFDEINKGSNISPVLQNGGIYATAYNKYLGEILAPMSIMSGWLSTGDRMDSQQALLGGDNYANTVVSFNTTLNEQLYDSILTTKEGGNEVKISSKAGAGASTSIVTIKSVLETFQKNQPQKFDEFTKKFADVVEYIDIISKPENSWFDGPVMLALKMGIIKSKQDSDMLEALKNDINISTEDFQKTFTLSEELNKILKAYKADTGPGYRPSFHLISAIAKEVCIQINSSQRFSEAMKELLSHSNLIQVNSNIKLVGENKQDCQFTEFKIKYPPTFKGTIKANSSRNYSSTRIRGKISFKIED